MKSLNLFMVLAMGLLGVYVSADAVIDPSLHAFGIQKGSTQVQRVVVLVDTRNNLQRPQRYDRRNVPSYFREASRRALLPSMQDFQSGKLKGVTRVQPFWLVGAFAADVTPEGLYNLSRQPTITKIYRNAIVHNDPVHKGHLGNKNLEADGDSNYAFASIGLDKLASEMPQVTGKNVVVGIVDTGVDGEHPALKGKVPLFYNGQTKTTTPPKDFDSHGTHVSGTVAGGDRKDNRIGVAPDAKVVMAGVVEQGFDSMLAGMQWFLDGDKNPIVAQKIKVIGCSWNTEGAPDQELFSRGIAAWEASGVLPVFSAGNAGTRGITHPHEYPGTFAVAAYGADGKVADFSSRGPGKYHDKEIQKPDLAAPGVNITSSVPGGRYQEMSGTSMAQPHVTGTVALLLQVNPNLNPQQLREILVRSANATDLGPAGSWSKEYGFGKLNAYAAVKAASLHFEQSRFEQLGNLFTDSLTLLASPEQVDLKAFAAAELGEVDGPQDQYQDTDAAAWLTVAQFYGSPN